MAGADSNSIFSRPPNEAAVWNYFQLEVQQRNEKKESCQKGDYLKSLSN